MLLYGQGMSDFSWGLFIVLAVGAICVAMGVSFGPLLLIGAVIGLLIAYRYPYFSLYTALALSPFLGIVVMIPTGALAIGERVFAGSIDVGVAEIVFLTLLVTWALKIFFLWLRRHDTNWKPRFPLIGSYSALLGAHLLSILSPLGPDRLLSLKFALRPVLFCYLAFVALPVNFIRSRRRLMGALSVMSGVGLIAALNGAVSLFFVDASSQFIRRAHPLPMFGIPALGDNHNLLAELLVVTVMMTLALAALVKKGPKTQLLYGSAIVQGAIGLLTFSRTGWIVFALQAMFIIVVEYRQVLRRQAAAIAAALIVLVPLGAIMAKISSSNVAQSSNSTRVALLEIATQVFEASPWVGGGAGTFVDRVGSASVFRLEYGNPLDAHGFLQKLAAETGVLGLLAFIAACAELGWISWRVIRSLPENPLRRSLVFLSAAAGGGIAYQLFNTDYWTAKMWLPIGILLAAVHVLRSSPEDSTHSL